MQSDLMRILPASEVNATKRVESKTFLWILLGAHLLSEAFVTPIKRITYGVIFLLFHDG